MQRVYFNQCIVHRKEQKWPYQSLDHPFSLAHHWRKLRMYSQLLLCQFRGKTDRIIAVVIWSMCFEMVTWSKVVDKCHVRWILSLIGQKSYLKVGGVSFFSFIHSGFSSTLHGEEARRTTAIEHQQRVASFFDSIYQTNAPVFAIKWK